MTQTSSRTLSLLTKGPNRIAQIASLVSFTVMVLAFGVGMVLAGPRYSDPAVKEALELGEEFGVIVGEVDEEMRVILGLQRAEGVVVYEVIAGRPADLAGIKVKAVIKEIDKYEIRNLIDFGKALKAALPTENFSVATYEAADPDNQGLSGGLNFHFVRTEKN